MKKCAGVLACLTATLIMSNTAMAAKTQLYALDGRTIHVDENQVEMYTAPGMGWYLEAPVTMYAADGRTLVVPADQVEAHKNVGWYLEGELDKETESSKEDNSSVNDSDSAQTSVPSEYIKIEYTDGTVVTVPYRYLETYKLLGWIEAGTGTGTAQTVIMYDADGNSKEVSIDDVTRYQNAGWTTIKPAQKPDVQYVKLYSYDGSVKEVPADQTEAYKSQGWYPEYDEAVYAYAAFGDGNEVLGATKLLEQKKYELAFNLVQDALDKIENTDSEYIALLDYLRTQVTDTWREAANSPLGFINYWFANKDGQPMIVFEYRNVSNSRIQFFKINFDICDKDGNVIERNKGFYYVDNLQMLPCEKKRVAWAIDNGSEAVSIKNLKVQEVKFSDGESWAAAN